ncbi:hypothetical protein OHC33_010794 [Knufia fluminis]|uniref:Uncharacterized protein n=1 Tax=Knufia fluminis TaxID=191047 RepID=A0AAN8I3A8_9EURO|nr:hypothetical protein OHC33_010794 [Knufia fluminis]
MKDDQNVSSENNRLNEGVSGLHIENEPSSEGTETDDTDTQGEDDSTDSQTVTYWLETNKNIVDRIETALSAIEDSDGNFTFTDMVRTDTRYRRVGNGLRELIDIRLYDQPIDGNLLATLNPFDRILSDFHYGRGWCRVDGTTFWITWEKRGARR